MRKPWVRSAAPARTLLAASIKLMTSANEPFLTEFEADSSARARVHDALSNVVAKALSALEPAAVHSPVAPPSLGALKATTDWLESAAASWPRESSRVPVTEGPADEVRTIIIIAKQ